MAETIKYEQPLSERIRTFLRLEFLFSLADKYLTGMTQHDMRTSLNTLLDIVDLVGRTDIKGEVIKELEKHAGMLANWKDRPGVDEATLNRLLDEIRYYLDDLRSNQAPPGQSIRQDEMLCMIKQRNLMPGGTCNFDMPSYHYWLNRDHDEHIRQFEIWQKDLAVFKNSIKLILHLIRNSTVPSSETAEKGFFQKTLKTGSNCQMIRVLLPSDSPYYPEISAGKHRFTIRFMSQPDTSVRPAQAEESVEFELHCCIL